MMMNKLRHAEPTNRYYIIFEALIPNKTKIKCLCKSSEFKHEYLVYSHKYGVGIFDFGLLLAQFYSVPNSFLCMRLGFCRNTVHSQHSFHHWNIYTIFLKQVSHSCPYTSHIDVKQLLC